eukprot:m.35789 g.35789  ORF g.35789 m.35789 type:complete len:164 (+) comp8951_c0_seq1:173-664(+)
MPPKKKGKGPPAPTSLKVTLRRFFVGEGCPDEPVIVELNPSCSVAKAKITLDKKISESKLATRPGSLAFGLWRFRIVHPSFQDPARQVRDVASKLLYDFNWLSSIGIQEESCICIHHDKKLKRMRLDWYINVPDVPPFRRLPTPEEIAAQQAAAQKSKKKKKK